MKTEVNTKSKSITLEVGIWYVVSYSDGTQKRFKFLGEEPPMVYGDGEGQKMLEAILRGCEKIYPDTKQE